MVFSNISRKKWRETPGVSPDPSNCGKWKPSRGRSSGKRNFTVAPSWLARFHHFFILELTEKLLVSLGGWPVFQQAKALHAAGVISDAVYEPPLLKGKIDQGGKQFLAGLKLKNPIDVENLCPCRDSRVRGVICAHSVAVGLQVLKPRVARGASSSVESAPSREGGGGVKMPPTGEVPEVHVLLEGSLRHLEATVSFVYPQRVAGSNPLFEAGVLQKFLEAGFRDFKGRPALQGEEVILDFYAAVLPRWRDDWKVTLGERFAGLTGGLVKIEPHFALRGRDDGWLDFHLHYTAGKDAVFAAADLNRLLQAGTRHIKLRDGRVAIADPGLAEDIEEVLRDCEPRQERGGYRIPPARRAYLEASVSGWGGQPASEKAVVSEADLGSVKTTLRPYQVEGALWLLERARRETGGILADEMGLGKTVQALALFETLPGVSLVVCPSSLVWNWRAEAARFLPGFPVLTLDGPDRASRFADIGSSRLVVTSYATLRRDIEKYAGLKFSAVLLDEAQHIKNPDSQNAKAACALAASSRFILTGTPVENSLKDLWSLFEFLLPGYLGSRQDFRDRYETPLSAGERGATWGRLARRLAPYLLRRRKADLLADLPDKIEQVISVDLTEEQKVAYTQLQVAARASIDALKEAGSSAGAARMRALTALLRLRQASCDLKLLGKDTEGSSAKRVALLELLEEARDGGHRTLVFSQFTGMLDLIEEDLRAQEMPFCRLDGSTKDRQGVVERFQNDASIPVFLISLKAGGTGLNLTAADTVIHFDPWWNPAAEAQASDRAHRIGQKNVVNVIKLIARDTIEERVLRMQQSKRELLDATLDAESALGSLSPADLDALV